MQIRVLIHRFLVKMKQSNSFSLIKMQCSNFITRQERKLDSFKQSKKLYKNQIQILQVPFNNQNLKKLNLKQFDPAKMNFMKLKMKVH